MDELQERLLGALRKYRTLGEEALSFLHDADWESCSSRLDEREKIFCNFQALDHLAQSLGFDLAQSPDGRLELAAAMDDHRDLSLALQNTSVVLDTVLRKLGRARGVVEGYRSGAASPHFLLKGA
jgi:hypothetical protein